MKLSTLQFTVNKLRDLSRMLDKHTADCLIYNRDNYDVYVECPNCKLYLEAIENMRNIACRNIPRSLGIIDDPSHCVISTDPIFGFGVYGWYRSIETAQFVASVISGVVKTVLYIVNENGDKEMVLPKSVTEAVNIGFATNF